MLAFKTTQLIKIFPSLIIYILGMVAFLLSDIFVVKFISDAQAVANWAFIKAVLMLASVVAVFGAEQSILRYPQNFLSCLKKISIRTIFYTVIIATFLYFFSQVKSFIFWFFSILGLSITIILYSALRTSLNSFLALLSQNLWKILIFIIIVLGSTLGFLNIPLIFLSAIYFSVFILFLILLKNKDWLEYYKNHKDEKVEDRYFFSISNFFIISALTLNISISFEQLTLNILGLTKESALYLAHTSALMPVVLILNGFLSFYLGPYVKNNINKLDKNKLSKLILAIFISSLFLSGLSLSIGYFFFNYFYSTYDFNIFISVSVLLVCVLRMLYIIPSSFVGVVGRDDLTKKYIILNLISILLGVLFVFLLAKENIFYFILVVAILNWLFRVGLGIFYSYRNLEQGNS